MNANILENSTQHAMDVLSLLRITPKHALGLNTRKYGLATYVDYVQMTNYEYNTG